MRNSSLTGSPSLTARCPELTESHVTFFDSPPITKLPGGKMCTDADKTAGYSEPPEAYGPFAFIATHLVMETIEKVGPDRARITEDLGNVKERPSVVGPITFDDHGQNITPLTTKYVVQDGKWVVWEDSEYAASKRKLKNLP